VHQGKQQIKHLSRPKSPKTSGERRGSVNRNDTANLNQFVALFMKEKKSEDRRQAWAELLETASSSALFRRDTKPIFDLIPREDNGF